MRRSNLFATLLTSTAFAASLLTGCGSDASSPLPRRSTSPSPSASASSSPSPSPSASQSPSPVPTASPTPSAQSATVTVDFSKLQLPSSITHVLYVGKDGQGNVVYQATVAVSSSNALSGVPLKTESLDVELEVADVPVETGTIPITLPANGDALAVSAPSTFAVAPDATVQGTYEMMAILASDNAVLRGPLAFDGVGHVTSTGLTLLTTSRDYTFSAMGPGGGSQSLLISSGYYAVDAANHITISFVGSDDQWYTLQGNITPDAQVPLPTPAGSTPPANSIVAASVLSTTLSTGASPSGMVTLMRPAEQPSTPLGIYFFCGTFMTASPDNSFIRAFQQYTRLFFFDPNIVQPPQGYLLSRGPLQGAHNTIAFDYSLADNAHFTATVPAGQFILYPDGFSLQGVIAANGALMLSGLIPQQGSVMAALAVPYLPPAATVAQVAGHYDATETIYLPPPLALADIVQSQVDLDGQGNMTLTTVGAPAPLSLTYGIGAGQAIGASTLDSNALWRMSFTADGHFGLFAQEYLGDSSGMAQMVGTPSPAPSPSSSPTP